MAHIGRAHYWHHCDCIDLTVFPQRTGPCYCNRAPSYRVDVAPVAEPRPAPVDLSWVTTEPNYKPGLADWLLAGLLAAALLTVVGFGVWAIAEVTR